MKIYQRFLIGIVIIFLALASLFFYWVYLNHVTPILMYHHVEESDQAEADKVSPEIFYRQMLLIKDFGYKVLSLDEYVKKLLNGDQPERKVLVITFDDGYENNYTEAFPILKEFGYPATIFLHVEKINTPGYLTWRQIEEMMLSNITFGSHTLSHPYLPVFPGETQFMELAESKRILEKKLKTKIDYVAYPVGAFSETTKELASKAGYLAALSTNRGYDPKNTDLYELNRVRISNSDFNKLYLWVKYAGYSNVFKKGKKPY